VVFEGEEVGDCEEVGVGRGGFGREEGGGLVEGMGRCVDDLVGEVVEDGGLWGGRRGLLVFFFGGGGGVRVVRGSCGGLH